jgi:hypothetical protein
LAGGGDRAPGMRPDDPPRRDMTAAQGGNKRCPRARKSSMP